MATSFVEPKKKQNNEKKTRRYRPSAISDPYSANVKLLLKRTIMKPQKDIHPEFFAKICECLEYSDLWANPLKNNAGGSDQFRTISYHLHQIVHELCKD